MISIINNSKINQYTPPRSHIITDSSETIKLLEQKCGFQKPWSFDDPVKSAEKSKIVEQKKNYSKIDFYL